MNDDYFYQTDNIPPIDVEQMQDFLDNPPLLCGDKECQETRGLIADA